MAVAAVFGFSPGGLGWELAIAPAIALVTSSLALIRGIAIGRRNLRVFVAWDLSVDALWLASFTLLWWFNVNSAVVWAAVYAIPGVALAYWVAIGFRRPWPEGRSFIRQSLPLVPAGFATILMLRMDRLFLPIQCSTTDLGLYVVAATTMEAASWIVAAHADWIVKRLTERGVGSVHPLTVLADAWWVPFLVLLAGLVASLWLLPFLGPSFEAARPLLIPLGVATLVLSVMRYLQAILVSTPTPSLSSWAAGIAAVSGLVVYPMLISRSCAPGAAWGSAIVYGIGALASLVLIQSARRASRDRF
jgi:O-antigen/teichoic acid export membrane protein